MKTTRFAALWATAALVAALSAVPASAQGKEKEKGEKPRAGQVRGEKGKGKAEKARAERTREEKRHTAKSGDRTRAERPRTVRRQEEQGGRHTARGSDRARREVRWDREYESRSRSTWSWDDERWRRSSRRHKDVPPGWCTGEGNPHNTVANCGPGEGRYDRRSGVYRERDGGYRSGDREYGSFNEAHDAFHTHHERVCQDRLAQRPFDPEWQIRVRRECSAEHDRWHDRYDPNADRSRVRLRLPF